MSSLNTSEKKYLEAILEMAGGYVLDYSDTTFDEEGFLGQEFGQIDFNKLPLDSVVEKILKSQLDEAIVCLNSKCYLAAIFMCGSILEGVLLGASLNNMKDFNQAKNCPRKPNGKPKEFQGLKLSELLNVAHALNLAKLDVKKFGTEVRDFRNYIHPYQQLSSGFIPRKQTAQICMKVLEATLHDLSE